MAYQPEPAYTHDTPARTAVLLVNLGTPDAPTKEAVKTYLREFLSDPRVVEMPRPIWWLILNGIILNTRPKKSAEKYASVWMNAVSSAPPILRRARSSAHLQLSAPSA